MKSSKRISQKRSQLAGYKIICLQEAPPNFGGSLSHSYDVYSQVEAPELRILAIKSLRGHPYVSSTAPPCRHFLAVDFKNVVVVCVHLLPYDSQWNEGLRTLRLLIQELSEQNRRIILCGDFNCHHWNFPTDELRKAKRYEHIERQSLFSSSISSPYPNLQPIPFADGELTRTCRDATQIDYFLVNFDVDPSVSTKVITCRTLITSVCLVC